MRRSKRRGAFPIGLMLFVLMVAIYKASRLTVGMVLDWRAFIFLVGLDGIFLALCLLLAILRGYTTVKLLRSLFWLMLVFMSVTYLLDSFVLLDVNENGPLFSVGRYSLEPDIILSIIDMKVLVAALLLFGSLFIVTRFSTSVRRYCILLLVIAVAAGSFCEVHAPQPLVRYSALSPTGLWEIYKLQQEQVPASMKPG